MKRKRLALLILLLLLIASVICGYFYYPRQKTVAKLKYPPGSRAVAERTRTAPAGSPESVSRMLRIDLLENVSPYTQYRRDMFKPLFIDRETMAAREAAAAAEAARKARSLLPPPMPVKPAPQPSGIQTELAAFRFHGFLKKDGVKTVFLAKGKELTPVKQGSIFAGRFAVTSVTDQVLILKVTRTGEEVVISLVENEPLRVVR